MFAIVFAAIVAHAGLCPEHFAGGQPPAAPGVVMGCFDGYAVGYDPTIGQPRWSAQHETADSVGAGAAVKRNGSFERCQMPDGSLSVSPSIYAHSGFDLGHQTEAGSRGPDKPQTFGTCNMSPQQPNLNRKIWAGEEAAVRGMAAAGADLYVVTGPVIGPMPLRMLGGEVAVPIASFKAVLVVGQGAEAIICQNTSTPTCIDEDVPTLTADIGFDPFPGQVETPIILPPPTKGAN